MANKDVDLASFLASADFSVPMAFIYGSDSDFIDSATSEAIDRIKKSRTDLGELERLSGDAVNSDPASVSDFFNERPLFGDHRFLVVSNISERSAAALAAILKGQRPEPGPFLLLTSGSLTAKSKLLNSARDAGFCTMVRAYEAPFSRQELSSRFNDLGVTNIEPQALDFAFRRLAGEDLALRTQTIRLLSLYATDGRLSLKDVEDCLPPGEDQLADELLAALLTADLKAMLAWRRRGAAEGHDTIAQLAVLSRALGEARRARLSAAGQGSGPRVFWKTDKIVKDAARKIHNIDERLERAISFAHRLERAARSSEELIPEKTERLLIHLSTLFR